MAETELTQARNALDIGRPTRQGPVALSIVPNAVSGDTVEALEVLLRKARRGEVIGMAYVAMLPHRTYIADTAGFATDNPTFSRGCLLALDDTLARRVGSRA